MNKDNRLKFLLYSIPLVFIVLIDGWISLVISLVLAVIYYKMLNLGGVIITSKLERYQSIRDNSLLQSMYLCILQIGIVSGVMYEYSRLYHETGLFMLLLYFVYIIYNSKYQIEERKIQTMQELTLLRLEYEDLGREIRKDWAEVLSRSGVTEDEFTQVINAALSNRTKEGEEKDDTNV